MELCIRQKQVIIAEDGTSKVCLSFGPIAVHPEYQRKGLGKVLIEATIKKAKELGYENIIIFGHLSNYVSIGFVSCIKMNVCIDEGYPTALPVRTLTDKAFDGRRLQFKESTAYESDVSDAKNHFHFAE